MRLLQTLLPDNFSYRVGVHERSTSEGQVHIRSCDVFVTGSSLEAFESTDVRVRARMRTWFA